MSPPPSPPRSQRVVPAMVVAAVVGAGLVTFVIDVVAVWTIGHSLIWPYRDMAARMRHTTWSDTPIIAIAAAITAVGVLLLIAAVVPGRKKLLDLDADRPATAAGISARHLRRALRRVTIRLDGVGDVTVNLRRHRAQLDVTTPYRDPGDLAGTVQTSADHYLDDLRLTRPLRTTVRTNHQKSA
jgi:hypothetical protein